MLAWYCFAGGRGFSCFFAVGVVPLKRMSEKATVSVSGEERPKVRRGWRILRVGGRALRVFLIVALVVVVAALVYLGQIGLPPFAHEKITARLRAQGWDVQFSRLRVSFSRMGLVAENVYLRRANGPHIYVRRAQCRLRPGALRRLDLEVAAIKLSGGRVVWDLESANSPASTFFANNLRGELHLRENDDVWDLQSFTASVMGAQIQLSGMLTNGSLVRDWRVPQLRRGVPAENLARWRGILQAVHQIEFQGQPELITRFAGDAANLPNSHASFMMHVPGVTSPWGSGSNLLITARLNDAPAAQGQPLELDVLFEHGRAPWAQAKGFRFKTSVGLDFTHLVAPTNLHALIEAESADGPWGAATNISGQVEFMRNSSSEALQTILNLETGSLRHERFEAATAEVHVSAWHTRTNWFIALLRDFAATNRPWSERLEHLPVEADFALSGGKAGAVDAEELLVRTQWRWPIATLAIEAKIEDGGLRGNGALNTTNGELTFDASSSIDPHRVSPLLTDKTRNWLTNYQWQAAPKVEARGRLTLPSPGAAFDWGRDVLPTLAVEGAFELGPCRYRAVPLDAAKSPFWFSNAVFALPALEVRRADGFARGQYVSRPATKDFHWRLDSQLHPKVLRPLFSQPAVQRGFALAEFSAPPRLHAEVWGRWGDPSRLGVIGNVEATNFTIRGQAVQWARSGLTFTNLQLELIEPEVTRPNERGNATRIMIDIKEQHIYFTNVQANLNPYVFARAIGSNTAKVIAPYVFAAPPDIHLNGVLDIKPGSRQDDMHFLISGGPFFWEPFHVNRIGGQLHWAGNQLLLNEVIAQLHGGQARGDAKFDISTQGSSQFNFRTEWSDINLRSLMRDLSPRTNNLEGIIRGNLQITSANSANRKSWNGRGMVELKDGLLWDFPMFSVFSPVLNAFVPGLGNSRARDGASSFIITNSVIHTTDLEINATAMRMQFNGTIDFDRRIDGRMEAELLRNVPAIGLVLSKILWPVTKIFEYKVAGTLQDPKTEPVYIIPKVILFPFSPIKTIRDLFSVDDEEPKAPANKPTE